MHSAELQGARYGAVTNVYYDAAHHEPEPGEDLEAWVNEIDDAIWALLGPPGLRLDQEQIRFYAQPGYCHPHRQPGWFLGSIVCEEICEYITPTPSLSQFIRKRLTQTTRQTLLVV